MVYDSPFLKNRNRIVENEIGFVILDGFPVSDGHCLVIPKRVYADYFESTEEEVIGLQSVNQTFAFSPTLNCLQLSQNSR